MISNHDRALARRQRVARQHNVRAVDPLEDELDAGPARPGDGAGEAVGEGGVEGLEEEEEGESEVLEEEGEGPDAG